MRGTSIFSLPGLLLGAALQETQTKTTKSLWWRVRYQYIMWRMDYDMQHFVRDREAGKYQTLLPEHLESFDRFKKFMDT